MTSVSRVATHMMSCSSRISWSVKDSLPLALATSPAFSGAGCWPANVGSDSRGRAGTGGPCTG